MSRMMEGVDLAICSAGRTVYELAHMHIPSIVLAQHEREARHTFARADHGFAYMGIMRKFNAGRLRKVLWNSSTNPNAATSCINANPASISRRTKPRSSAAF